jgi:hypothetical protein
VCWAALFVVGALDSYPAWPAPDYRAEGGDVYDLPNE